MADDRPDERDLAALEARRAELRERHLRPPGERPASTARGLHHTALISSDRLYLAKKKKEGNASAAIALRHLENLDYLLSATQFGSNLCIATATTLATVAFKKTGADDEFLFFAVFAPLALIFSDSLPKVIGRVAELRGVHRPDMPAYATPVARAGEPA